MAVILYFISEIGDYIKHFFDTFNIYQHSGQRNHPLLGSMELAAAMVATWHTFSLWKLKSLAREDSGRLAVSSC